MRTLLGSKSRFDRENAALLPIAAFGGVGHGPGALTNAASGGDLQQAAVGRR